MNTSALSSAPPVLPHRSRNATGSAATGFYSTGSSHGQISYHGGPLLTGTVNAYFIWYGAWAAEDRAILETLISQLSSSQYFHINDSYHDASLLHHPSQVRLAGFTSDNYSWGTTVDDNAIFAIVSGAIAGGQMQVLFPFPTGAVDPNGVYFVLTSPDVTVLDGFCSENCGWHGSRLTGGQQIKYAFVGNSGWQCPDACEEQTGSSPNDNPGIDGMASVMVHELEEAATDPIGNGWYTPVAGQREENADKCAWTFGTTYAAANGATANIALGGHDYLIQQNWVNAASGGYCSLTSALPFYAGNARIFAGSGDWQFGSYKAECDRNAAATGLSKYPDAVSGHSLLCQSNDTGAFPHAVCHNVDFSAGDRRGTVDTGDWDTGFNKGECAGDEYVAGVSQFTNGPLHSILCCKGRVAHNACGALTFAAGDAGEPSLSSNWDNGFNKAECGPGRYMAGVSRDRQSGAGNSILCCSP